MMSRGNCRLYVSGDSSYVISVILSYKDGNGTVIYLKE